LSDSNETTESLNKKGLMGTQRVIGHLMQFVSERRRKEQKKNAGRVNSRSISRATPLKPQYTSPSLKSTLSKALIKRSSNSYKNLHKPKNLQTIAPI